MSLGRLVVGASTAVFALTAVASAGFTPSPHPAGASDPEPGAAGAGAGVATVVLDIEHSRFVPERVEVVAGTEVVFVLRNGDPIGHELIVGDDAVHARHESGAHAAHGAVAGEVSVAPLAEASTTYAFDEVGAVRFACHLPGHVAYGMEGEVVVVEA